MAQWHLDELLNALEKRGWRLIEQHAGDDYRVSATWELKRGSEESTLLLDFDGLDDMVCLPLEKAYGCSKRGTSKSICFGRRGVRNSAARDRWRSELKQFIDELGEDDTG